MTRCFSDYLFELKDLISGKLEIVHSSRVMFFRNDKFEVTEQVTTQLQYQEGQRAIIARFLDISEHSGVLELNFEYRGFEGEERTWVTIHELLSEVYELVRDYFAERKVQGSEKQAHFVTKAEVSHSK